jgi:16S rRNA (guanine(966)-N(2))-methyltransferase RsmD
MRVIGGEFRSRRLVSPPGLDTRPTPDRLRETLFNILAPRIEGAVFVDLYAGTGAVGIEALSRGASRVIFVERGHAAVEAIRENVRSLGATARAEIRQGKVSAMIDRVIDPLQPVIVFLDPPYDAEQEYETAFEKLAAIFADRPATDDVPPELDAGLITGQKPARLAGQRPALVVTQHSTRLALKEAYGPLRRTRVLKQGDNALSFYEVPLA